MKRTLDFYYYSPFLYGNISVCQIWRVCNMLMHIYLSGVSINRMLIFQLKIFLIEVENLCFHLDSMFNLAFISHFYAVVIRIIQTFEPKEAML